MRMCGNQYGRIYQRQLKPVVENCRDVATKEDHVVPGNPAVKQLDLHALGYVTVVDTVKNNTV